jgi:hypothetical protein
MNQNARKTVLNAGSGGAGASQLPPAFDPAHWSEVRLDVDPTARPDIVGSFTDMRGAIGDGRFDALFCSHALEHLYGHDVIPALREFVRVLAPGGFALVTCPDLAAISRHILQHGDESIAYQSAAGPIRPIDMLYGHNQSIADGRPSMAHRTGFTATRLARVAIAAGFAEVRVIEGKTFDLWALFLTSGARLSEIAPIFAGSPLRELVESGAPPPAVAAGAAGPHFR